MKTARNKRCPRGTTIQTIIFDKRHFTKTQAREWITRYGEAAGKADEAGTGNYFRYRQREPGDFEKGSFRTITLAPDVKAIIGCPKQRTNPRRKSGPFTKASLKKPSLYKSLLISIPASTLRTWFRKEGLSDSQIDIILQRAHHPEAPTENPRGGRRGARPVARPPKRRANRHPPCPSAPDPLSYNPKRRKAAKRTEARRKNADIHIDIGSHNAPEKNPAINIPKTVVILGAALDMEVRTKEKILLYSWNSPHQRGRRHAKKIEAFVCSNTLGNELYILPNKTKHVKPDRLIPLVERHRDAPDAARLFQRWADFPAHDAAVLETPRVKLHRIGTACALSYFSDKWSGKTRAYIHKFKTEPEIYACTKSKIFTIFSKRIRVTKDGIKG